MVTRIVRTASCVAPVEVAFAYVADHRNIPRWMAGIERFDPVGEQVSGVGAVFDVTAHFGVRLHTRIRAVEWVPGRLIAMESVTGVPVTTRFGFEPAEAAGSRVTAEVGYALPGGLAGRAMAAVMGPVVRQAVDHAQHRLAAEVERAASDPRA